MKDKIILASHLIIKQNKEKSSYKKRNVHMVMLFKLNSKMKGAYLIMLHN